MENHGHSAWLAVRATVAVPEVLISARGEPLSRWGFAYLLKQHVETAAQQCPGLLKKRVSPHVLRHACAMIVLQATQDIGKVSLWLGHANLTTTEVTRAATPRKNSRPSKPSFHRTCAKASSGRRIN